jgi:hypothetical protein
MITDTNLAIEGGLPVRTGPLPLEFPGSNYMNHEESDAVARVIESRSPFRYYGLKEANEVDTFETEVASFLGVSHVSVST